MTLEEIIHEGRILILDLPIAESGGSTLTALLAVKVALSRLLVGRYRALHRSQPLSRRGVLVIQDEAHLLLSRPKQGTSSEGAALSVIREFGVIWLLACQSMSLIASTLGNEAQTAALLAGARTRVFGATSDAYTAQMASILCGSGKGRVRPLGCLWHPTPALEQAIAGAATTS
ncbi:MAG: TraG/TraD/VirD4 family protein, partial [Verrucomicrobiota bacterium]|nr:TraG/TraD/VirD4 family protein [Verrucomicrobiota bacterium]